MSFNLKKLPGIAELVAKLDSIKQLEYENRLKLDELNWANVFNSAIADSKWLHNRSFNPGRWAAGYPMLYILYRIYNDIKPKNILEFGLGESSKLAYQYNLSQPDAALTVVEQDKNWLDFFSKEIHDISANTLLLPVETQTRYGHQVLQYQNLLQTLGQKKFDMMVVDGPFGSKHYSRPQVIDLVANNLNHSSFTIIIDDYEREGERETAAKLREMLESLQIPFSEGVYAGQKQTLLICSKNLNFLTSL